MSGASFAITLEELRIIVASDRGYGLDPADWNERQTFVIDQVVTSAVAQVYFPPPVKGERLAPDWTFLKPITEVGLASGSQRIKMPADFGSVDGPIAVKTTATTSMPWWIEWRNENWILGLYQGAPALTGPPKFAAETVLRDHGAPVGQRRGLLIFPIADQDYVLQIKYSINPDRLSGACPYAYGGAQYRELYVASVYAVAEQQFDGVMGTATQKFDQMLLAAISQDNKNRPQKLGYNANRETPAWRGHRHVQPNVFYYNDDPIT